jgi:hypothetical protein
MANVPLDHQEDEGVEIDDPELLAELDAAMEEAERGEYGRDLEEILAEVRNSK